MINRFEMSLFEVLYLIITGVGVAFLSVQLWMQRKQIKILIRTIEVSANLSVAERTIGIDKIFLDKPHLAEYFLENGYPTPSDLPEAKLLAILLLNYLDIYFLAFVYLTKARRIW
jgi:hypothetical protein